MLRTGLYYVNTPYLRLRGRPPTGSPGKPKVPSEAGDQGVALMSAVGTLYGRGLCYEACFGWPPWRLVDPPRPELVPQLRRLLSTRGSEALIQN